MQLMKIAININQRILKTLLMLLSLFTVLNFSYGQDDSTAPSAEEAPAAPSSKPVKNTFDGIWIIDNQTVMVPIKGTFELDFMHRFGTIENGYQDFFGLFSGTNIRLGSVSY